MNISTKIKVKPYPPFTAEEECRMLNAKVEAARYVLERTRKDNIYQQRLDELYPNYIKWKLQGMCLSVLGKTIYINKDLTSFTQITSK